MDNSQGTTSFSRSRGEGRVRLGAVMTFTVRPNCPADPKACAPRVPATLGPEGAAALPVAGSASPEARRESLT